MFGKIKKKKISLEWFPQPVPNESFSFFLLWFGIQTQDPTQLASILRLSYIPSFYFLHCLLKFLGLDLNSGRQALNL